MSTTMEAYHMLCPYIAGTQDDEKMNPKYEYSQTDHVLLEGASGWSPIMYIRLVQDFGIDPEVRSDFRRLP